jgi:hypothetical protein
MYSKTITFYISGEYAIRNKNDSSEIRKFRVIRATYCTVLTPYMKVSYIYDMKAVYRVYFVSTDSFWICTRGLQ